MKKIVALALLPTLFLAACQAETAEPSGSEEATGAASGSQPGALKLAPIAPNAPIAPSPIGVTPFPPIRKHCSAVAPFRTVTAVEGIASGQVNSVALTANELELYATSYLPGSGLSALLHMTRASIAAPFVVTPEPFVTSASGFDAGVGLSRDGLALYVSVPVPSAAPLAPAGMELQVAHRTSIADHFGPLESTGLAAPYPWHITQMAPSPSGDSLFASVAVGGAWRIKEISVAAPLLDLSLATQTAFDPSPMASGVVATADGTYAYVGQGSWVSGGALLFSVALAEKPLGATKYGVPAVLGAPVNDGKSGGVPQWLSSDECSLYYIAMAPGGTYLQLNIAKK